MAGPSDQQRSTVGEPRGTTAQDAEAEERATDEGMPEHPGSATSEAAARTDPEQGGRPTSSRDEELDGPATLDDLQEDDGAYDLGGEA
jgi:hypothetical protein